MRGTKYSNPIGESENDIFSGSKKINHLDQSQRMGGHGSNSNPNLLEPGQRG